MAWAIFWQVIQILPFLHCDTNYEETLFKKLNHCYFLNNFLIAVPVRATTAARHWRSSLQKGNQLTAPDMTAAGNQIQGEWE